MLEARGKANKVVVERLDAFALKKLEPNVLSATGEALFVSATAVADPSEVMASSLRHRSSYDKNTSGDGAPHTDWISKKSLSVLCNDFSKISFHLENTDTIPFFRRWSRKQLLATFIPRYIGLDLYATLTK